MDIGFIGLGKMGFPMARHLIEAKHRLVVFDTRKEAVLRRKFFTGMRQLSKLHLSNR